MIGPGLVDFVNFRTLKNNQVNLEIQQCIDPLFLIPLLYRSVQKNIYSKISNQNKILTILGNNKILRYLSRNGHVSISKRMTNGTTGDEVGKRPQRQSKTRFPQKKSQLCKTNLVIY